MKNRIKDIALVVVGMFLGATLFGGVAYAATGVMAERSSNRVFVDGREVELESYLIDGSNYVKLRDVAQAVNFNVFWDGAVQIDSAAPYTGDAPIPAAISEPEVVFPPSAGNRDFSADANPNAFSGVYTREAYNAAFAVLEGLRCGDESVTAPLHIATQEDRWKLENMLGKLSNGYTLSLRGITGQEMYEIYVVKPDRELTRQHTAELIAEVTTLPTERDKVIRLNEYLCDRIIYDPKQSQGVNDVTSSEQPVYGNCITFARAMNDLCARSGIRCMRVSGEHHTWNLIYCDGAWGYFDGSYNDQTPNHMGILFSDTPTKQIEDPAGVRFLQELLAPGSTK